MDQLFNRITNLYNLLFRKDYLYLKEKIDIQDQKIKHLTKLINKLMYTNNINFTKRIIELQVEHELKIEQDLLNFRNDIMTCIKSDLIQNNNIIFDP